MPDFERKTIAGMSAIEAIVRELADIPPLAYDMGWYCVLCNGGVSWDYDTSMDPAHHNPACPWRRAVELVEGEG